MLSMDMSEKMSFEIIKSWESFEDFLRAIVDAVVKVEDAISRGMGYQYVCVGGNSGIVAALAVGYAIAHEQRDTVEFNTIYFDAGVAQVMHVIVKAVDVGSIQAVIVVAANENLVAIWQIAELVEKINRFLLASDHTEVSGMYHHISLGQIPEPMVTVMRI